MGRTLQQRIQMSFWPILAKDSSHLRPHSPYGLCKPVFVNFRLQPCMRKSAFKLSQLIYPQFLSKAFSTRLIKNTNNSKGDSDLRFDQQSIMKSIIALLTILIVTSCQLSSFELTCSICHDLLFQFQKTIPIKPTEVFLNFVAAEYCVKKHLQNANVCKGAIKEMSDSIINSVWRHYTDPHAICHKLRLCPKQYKIRNLTQDIAKILKGKPQKEWQKPTGRKHIKVMHISDLHIDLFYTAGAQMKCSEPVCCRSNVSMQLSHKEVVERVQNKKYLESQEDVKKPAGYWGSYSNCDLPFQTFVLFTEELRKMDVDLILWTGDNTPHDVWQQTQSYNLNFTHIQSQRIQKVTKTRVVAAMGNHQSFPVNVYDYEGQRQKMLIGGLAEAWKPWMDDKAYQMLRTKGYFSITLPEFKNLKIISVNTQAQNDMNWFLVRNPTDAGKMLQWIQEELKDSEEKGTFVWIIGHISPKSALNQWSMRFNALTDRYSYIIRGQFYGHSHTDHIGFFPTFANKSKISNYFFIAPSLTTYSDKNPEYRIMTVDLDSLQVVDYDQYRLDLSKYTKKEQDAKFQLFYNFKSTYKLDDLTITGGMSTLRHNLENDNQTQITYSYLRSSGVEKGHAGRDIYCDTMSSPQYSAECHNPTPTKSKKSYFQQLAGPWKDLTHK